MRRTRILRIEELDRKILLAVIAGGTLSSADVLAVTSATMADMPVKLEVSLVLSNSLPADSEVMQLESSIDSASLGDLFYAQIWVKNIDGSSDACVGGYLDLVYTDTVFQVGSFSPSSLFPNLANYISSENPGRIALVGGMSSPGESMLAVNSWALLGSVSFNVIGEGDGLIQTKTPTRSGIESEVFNLARSGVGTVSSSEIRFGEASLSVSVLPELDSPSITTGKPLIFVSSGANRHRISWTSVENASFYDLVWSVDGSTFFSAETTALSLVVAGLPYGKPVTYKVRARDNGFADSPWSAEETFYVCPVDVNGDGDVSGGDRSLLVSCWLSGEGDDEFIEACDINGDGDITGADRSFLVANWLFSLDEDIDDFVYPPAKASLFDRDAFEFHLDPDIEFFP